jgi:hypothetical protein
MGNVMTTSRGCEDSTRYPNWPDSPPLVTVAYPTGFARGYTWVKNHHINPDLSEITADPSTTLYRTDYQPDSNDPTSSALPQPETIDGAFWAEGEIPYGAYGGVVRNGTAYLWGQTSGGTVALARVLAESVEDKSAYEYWVNGAWVSEMPSLDDSSINIPSTSAGGQGTYYYSDFWQSYVWIGQASISVSADFFITTAPEPQGPWIEPVNFYSGGDREL